MPDIDRGWPTKQADTLLDQLNLTTRRTIGKKVTLHEADAANFDIPTMDPAEWDATMQAVQGQFADFLGSRAGMVARDQAAVAYERGGYAVAQALAAGGMDLEKAWDGDADACEKVCSPNVDQDWIGIDDVFESGDDTAPAHPDCGCNTLYRLAEA